MNVYEVVTDRIIAAMEAGTVPWRVPWKAGGPVSLSTGKSYRGANALILNLVGCQYSSNLWGTFKQAQALGGSVRKGEKGTPVILWKPVVREDKNGEEKRGMMVRYFTVFNLDQMDDVEVPTRFDLGEPVEVSDALASVLAYGPEVVYRNQDRAYYEPTVDRITLPMREQFATVEAFAGTALHEIAHSTGHESRLGRIEPGAPFGCEAYAREELVAEIGAAFMAASLGIEVQYDQAAAYLESWLRALKDDRKLIVSAAQAAQKAADLALGADRALVAA